MSTLLSVSADAEATTAAAVAVTAVVDEQLDAETEAESQAATAATRTRQWTDVPGASQTLLWGAAEADDAERAALIRRLGGRVDDDNLDRVAKQRNASDASARAAGGAGGGRLTDAGFVGEGAGGVGSRVGRRRAAAAAAAAAAAGRGGGAGGGGGMSRGW
ncbi:hypothetical protein IWX90DRAFT_418060 [Phyllosticta citrichinensis]|uniref:Uncharacterized protein n=1 Tax=Phyllosticta citrichinensis TaxID=1130410 RepID=A0ABR1XJP5_9PEZI